MGRTRILGGGKWQSSTTWAARTGQGRGSPVRDAFLKGGTDSAVRMRLPAESCSEVTRLPVEQRRAALIQAALRVISEHGLAAATTRAIVAEAGMSLASFHYAFESRDAMLGEIISTVTRSENEAVLEAVQIQDATDFTETIRLALLAYLDFLVENGPREHALLELTHWALHTERMRRLAVDQYAAYRASAAALAEHIAGLWGYEWTEPLELIARHVVMITDGVTMNWLVDHDTEQAKRILQTSAVGLASYGRPATS